MISATHAGPFRHPAFFYRNSDEYLTGTMDFVRAGLAAGEPVAVSVPAAKLALLRAALGTDVAAVRMLDMTVEGRNPGRIIPAVLCAFADRHATGRVRIVGEPVWAGRSAMEYPACAQHEALINAAFRGRDVTILCPYDLAALPAHMIADARATHPCVIGPGGEIASAAYDPDHIVDTYNRPLPDPPATATVLGFDGGTLARVRHHATDFARAAGLSERRVAELELIVGEATTNSVVHAGGGGTLALWCADGQLCCRIRDRGHIADPLAGRLPAALSTPGGRGLLLINHLADLVRIHTRPEGTTLHVELAV
ncbi:sensor histidine kinase [Nocardia sp. BMG111209]|uniref:sensor histidine kinase n=1 Tax=Nocardia sp. BMG111209 TaxID=1160137 RepID=UPI000365DF60|nr:sensor histidine kinase [Nocardia sp. BMG111209]